VLPPLGPTPFELAPDAALAAGELFEQVFNALAMLLGSGRLQVT